jgi:predicted metal-dependent HD superfamily phosphohydrolase
MVKLYQISFYWKCNKNINIKMNFQKILNKYNIKCDINLILSMWNEPHRFYHSLSHLNDLISQINNDKDKYSEIEYDKLILTALFHDIIYNPGSSSNEEESADMFESCCINFNSDLKDVKNMILDTKTHIPTTKLSEIFIKYDMDIVNRNFDELLEWEDGIYNENKHFDEIYKEKRIEFLESLLDTYYDNSENLLKLIEFVRTNVKSNKFVYHSSNPYYRESILKEGLIPKGKSETWLSNTKIDDKVIFVSNSDDKNKWFNSTYDDDIYKIDTTGLKNKFFLDPNFNSDLYLITYDPIPLENIKLIYKGTGNPEG